MSIRCAEPVSSEITSCMSLVFPIPLSPVMRVWRFWRRLEMICFISCERPMKNVSWRRSCCKLWLLEVTTCLPTCSFFHLDMKERTKERVKAFEKMPEIFAHFAGQNETWRLRRLRTTFCSYRSVRFDFQAAFFQRPVTNHGL